ncbi:adenosine receptor A2b-like [Patiria miniata]|uniref:G-protein coupled receptors family 1 profile domain-containing protein n=1 Tax=Patiria miniata TaxID=46514 RepID=A0A914ASC3_PATMI|nr:adenosine receptor A2b-like [Patiria miniata]
MAVNVEDALQYSMTGICTLAVIENLIAIAVFAGTQKLRIKYYTFVVNLALADLIFALFTIPYPWRPKPKILQGFFTGAYTVSLLTFPAVAVNRYLALSLMPPARYDSLVTGRRMIGVCILFWCLSFVYGLVIYNAVPKDVYYLVNFLGYSLAGCVVLAITALVYFLVFRKIKQYTPPLASAAGISANEERDRTRVKQTRRLLVMFVLILVVAFITWFPCFVLRMIAILNPSLGLDEIFQMWIWVSYLLYTLSPVINPWIYWWQLDGFREGFYAMFCRCIIKAEPSEIEADLKTVAETGL